MVGEWSPPEKKKKLCPEGSMNMRVEATRQFRRLRQLPPPLSRQPASKAPGNPGHQLLRGPLGAGPGPSLRHGGK